MRWLALAGAGWMTTRQKGQGSAFGMATEAVETVDKLPILPGSVTVLLLIT